ncbi:MAG: type II toxin-antitoxin system Phd/YefM family antitoxin [Chloroflexota bacterium]|nr:type II toxin-antitoxin system Phd/YefM family antitoxin [Chloroflexota bacterium]
MTVRTISSEEARNNFRDILDDAIASNEVIIERYSKPVAVVVNYDRWNMVNRQFLAMLDQRSKEMTAGDYVTLEEMEAGLKERGLLE